MKRFEDLLRQFEGPTVSPEAITELIESVNAPWFEGVFTGWINKRIREKISYPELMNYIKYSSLLLELTIIGDLINSILVGNIMLRKSNYDYFFHIINNESRRGSYTLIDRTIRAINYHNLDEALNTLKLISENTPHQYHDLVLKLLEAKTEAQSLSNMLTMNKLPLTDQYEILTLACLTGSVVFKDLVLSLDGQLREFAITQAYKSDNKLCKALMVTPLSISALEQRYQLTDFLLAIGPNNYAVISHLVDRAEKEQCWNYVLKLAPVFNKKEALRILLKAKDPILIDKFFFKYKEYPEVKNLTPFL